MPCQNAQKPPPSLNSRVCPLILYPSRCYHWSLIIQPAICHFESRSPQHHSILLEYPGSRKHYYSQSKPFAQVETPSGGSSGVRYDAAPRYSVAGRGRSCHRPVATPASHTSHPRCHGCASSAMGRNRRIGRVWPTRPKSGRGSRWSSGWHRGGGCGGVKGADLADERAELLKARKQTSS